MANAAKLAANPAVRMLLMGYPGAGKTGALASLANAGFKLRILDFDGNPESLILHTEPDKLQNIDIMSFEDPLKEKSGHVGPEGLPKAFANALKAMDHWKYVDDDGTEVDLGQSKDWGPDTVVVLDGLTGLGKAAMRRAQAVMNKTPLNTTQAVWGLAIADQEAFIEKLTSAANRFHLVCISHLKMVGPKDIGSGDVDLTREIKMQQADLVPTRLYPSALGWALPQTIGQHFPVIVNISVEVRGKSVRRQFAVSPRQDMDLKMPSKAELGELGVENGLLRIFEALGAKAPKT